MAAALGYHPDRTKAQFYFHLQQDASGSDSLISMLEQLKGFYTGWCCCGIGWFPLEPQDARPPGHAACPADWGAAACLRARAESGGIPVGCPYRSSSSVECLEVGDDGVVDGAGQVALHAPHDLRLGSPSLVRRST
jgi:hypothetical protein